MTLNQLQTQYQQLNDQATNLLARTSAQAERENRAMTAAERAALTALIDERNQVGTRIAEARGQANRIDAIDRLTAGMNGARDPGGDFGGGGGRRTLGQQFVNSPAYQYIRDTANNRPQAWQSPIVELHATTLDESAGSGGPLVIPDHQPGIIPTATRRLVVSGLIAPGTTTSNLISFMKETAFTNAAAAVAEGAAKPESTLVFTNATSKVEKIAHWIPVTDEILSDVAQMQSYIDGRMRLGVDLAEDDELLNGSGVSPHLRGFLHLTTPAPPIARVGEVNADVILKQIAAIENATNLAVDGIVMNPLNWLTVLLSKDTNGNPIGGGGPFQTPRTPVLWGRPVAVTSAIVAGTALVGSFASGGAQLFKHGGMRVDVSNSHADFFIKNLLAVRAEIREALAVYREAAFGLVTNLN